MYADCFIEVELVTDLSWRSTFFRTFDRIEDLSRIFEGEISFSIVYGTSLIILAGGR